LASRGYSFSGLNRVTTFGKIGSLPRLYTIKILHASAAAIWAYGFVIGDVVLFSGSD